MATCPVCSFDSLVSPPWSGTSPSNELCPRCGIQFGYDDAVGLVDPGSLSGRHGDLREQWLAVSGTAPDPESLPLCIRPDGPYSNLFAKKKQVVDSEVFRRYQARERLLSRPLTDEHIQVLAAWANSQPDERPDTAGARGPEFPMFLRQVAAQAILDQDLTKVSVLAKAAFVMGAWVVDVREDTWQLLRYARQVGDSVDGDGMAHLRRAAEAIGPVATAAFGEHESAIASLAELPVVFHQPSGIALIEDTWTEKGQAEDVARNVTWTAEQFLSYDHRQRPWNSPEPAFLPQHAPGEMSVLPTGDTRAHAVDSLNAFLISRQPLDALRVIEIDASIEYRSSVLWAARYWAGAGWTEQFPDLARVMGEQVGDDHATPSEALVVVHRFGAPQFTWWVN